MFSTFQSSSASVRWLFFYHIFPCDSWAYPFFSTSMSLAVTQSAQFGKELLWLAFSRAENVRSSKRNCFALNLLITNFLVSSYFKQQQNFAKIQTKANQINTSLLQQNDSFLTPTISNGSKPCCTCCNPTVILCSFCSFRDIKVWNAFRPALERKRVGEREKEKEPEFRPFQ